ncbi:hypothetical protein RchiOBHm_Chr7g0216911 [Rosa chinensis]|uniref:Uncharacterized protein n=1 Tax=Rosa chinensis TaxID=74649 RepID=A0A2P6PBV5_ROSCH|nr:hypothetical protein RchiOBHm_Chr7g0216911 [Rosa chinensis]
MLVWDGNLSSGVLRPKHGPWRVCEGSISVREDRCRSVSPGSWPRADAAIRRRFLASPRWLDLVRRLSSRSPGEVFAQFWIWIWTLVGVLGGLRRGEVVRRRGHAGRRWCAPRGWSGAGGWFCWAAALGPWGRWWMGRVCASGPCWWFSISGCVFCCFVGNKLQSCFGWSQWPVCQSLHLVCQFFSR